MAKAEAAINQLLKYLESKVGEDNSWATPSYMGELERELKRGNRAVQQYLRVLLSLRIIEINKVNILSDFSRKAYVITILKPGSVVHKKSDFYQIQAP